MISRLGTAALLFGLALTLRSASAESAGLRLLFVGNAAPFSSAAADGKPEGYAVTLCERIARAIRVSPPMTWQQTSIAEGLDRLANNEADLLCGPVSDTVAREQRADFSSPIAVGGIGAILRPGAPPWLLRLLHIEQANPAPPRELLAKLDWSRRIAVLRGGTAAPWLQTLLAQAQVDVAAILVEEYGEAARLLVAGDVGAWVGEWSVLSQRVKLDPRLARMTLVPRPIVGEPLAIAMRADPVLRHAVQAELSAIVHGPDFAMLAEHWFGQAGRTQSPTIQSVTPPIEPRP
jgi:polar amino acid transport system substrate-binding protein